MKYDPIMCMMVDDSVKSNDELSLAQKKQVVTELKGFLKKSYNFSDESEYARAYEDLRQMFTTGSKKSISGLFENAVKKTGSHDSVKAEDRDPYSYEEIKKDIQLMKSGKASYITKNGLIGRISHSFNNRTPQSGGITKEQKTELMNLVMSVKDERTIDKAIRSCDEVGCKTRDKSMSEMKIDELRDLAVSLGADKNKLYGTSKQALIIIIDNLKKKI